MRERVEKALNDVRPHLQADGGDVELVDVENNIVKGKIKGCLCRLSHVPDDTQTGHRAVY